MKPSTLPEIVLVEDSLDDEMLSLRGIARAGIPCHVTVMRDGEAALKHLLSPSPGDLIPTAIFLDYQLPKFTGIEVLTKLRTQERTRFIPVIIISGTNSGRFLTECYQFGANSCVVKPQDPTEYVDRLAKIAHYWLTINQGSADDSWVPYSVQPIRMEVTAN